MGQMLGVHYFEDCLLQPKFVKQQTIRTCKVLVMTENLS